MRLVSRFQRLQATDPPGQEGAMPRPEETREAAAHAAAHAAHDYGSGSSGAVTGGSNTWLVGGDWTMNLIFSERVGNSIIPIDFYSYWGIQRLGFVVSP